VSPRGTILFADDDPDFLKTRAEFLEKEGYQVIPATNPTEARRLLEQGGIDLAVLDIRLVDDDDEKDTSGLTLAKEVAREAPKIILTNFPSYQAAREALGPALDGMPPAVDFLDKKDGPEALLQAIRRVETAEIAGTGKRQFAGRRLMSGWIALVCLLLAVGTGLVAVVTGDPRWLLATVFLAILTILGTGLWIFSPEE